MSENFINWDDLHRIDVPSAEEIQAILAQEKAEQEAQRLADAEEERLYRKEMAAKLEQQQIAAAAKFYEPEQSKEYLKNLGYRTGDKVWLAALAAKAMPMEARVKANLAWTPKDGKPVPINPMMVLEFDEVAGGKLTRKFASGKEESWGDGLAYLQKLNDSGYGIYVRPNVGGHKDKDITHCSSFFYECDGISKKQQWEKVESLRKLGFKPTQVVETKNSLHTYYKIEENQIEGWRQYQQRLIQLQNSDPSIFNESQLMRLPGYRYWSWQEKLIPFPVTIKESNPDCIYNRTQFDEILPAWSDTKWKEPDNKAKQYKQKKEGAITTASGDWQPWDIRVFSQHFDGYQAMSDGWMQAKCPHHNGNGFTSFRVNLETGAFKCWAGCRGKDIYASGLALAKQRGHAIPKKKFEEIQKDWKEDYKKRCRKVARFTRTRKADVSVSSGYLPQIKLTEIPQGIVGLTSAWGGGKTHLIAKWLKEDWHHEIIQIGHRNSLLENTAQRFGLMHHSEAKDLNVLGIFPKLATTDITLGSMIDVGAYEDSPFVLVLDEVEQVLLSLTHNQNLKGTLRQQYRMKLEWLIKNATYIICSDADLSDATLEYIETIRGDGKKTFLIEHTGKPGIGRFPIKITSSKGYTLLNIKLSILAKKNVIVSCETKGDLKAIESTLKTSIKEKELEHNLLPLIIHGDNSQEKEIKNIIEHIDTAYLKSKSLGYTGSLGTGVDLSTKHFDKRYGIFTADVFGCTEQCQMLFRYRPDVETEIYCSDKVITKEIDVEQIILKLKLKHNESSKLLEDNIKDLLDKGLRPDWLTGDLPESENPYIKLWATHEARINASMGNPYECLIDRLKDSGFEIVDLGNEEDAPDIIKEQFKNTEISHSSTKKDINKQEDILTAKAELLDDNQYESLKKQSGSLTLEDRRKVTKTRLHKTLGIEITDEIVEMERKNHFTSAVKSLNMLLVDDETASAFELQDVKNNPIVTDRRHGLSKRKFLQDLGIPAFLKLLQQDGYNYSAETPVVKQIAEAARKEAAKVKMYLGWSICFQKNKGNKGFKQTDVCIVNKILSNLGVETKATQSGKSRFYSLDRGKWERVSKILEHMSKDNPKISKFIETPPSFSGFKTPEPLRSNDSSSPTPPPYIYNPIEGGVDAQKPSKLGVPAISDFEKSENPEKTKAEKLGEAAAALEVVLEGNSAKWEQVAPILRNLCYTDLEGILTLSSWLKLKALVPADEVLISF